MAATAERSTSHELAWSNDGSRIAIAGGEDTAALLIVTLPAGGRAASLQRVPTSGLSPATAQAPSESFYKRVGGYDVIAAVVDDFFGRFAADPELKPFLGGLNAAAGARVRQNFIDLFCARTGGPCVYNGRDMKSAHTGLAIRDTHFEAVIRHFTAALDAQNVRAREKEEFLTMLRGLKADIVQG